MDNDLVLTGSDLENPTTLPDLPAPEPLEDPSDFVASVVSPTVPTGDETLSIFDAQELENRKAERDDVFSQLSNVSKETPSFSDQFTSRLRAFGTPDAVNELRDVQTQLNKLSTSFDLRNVRIQDGNSLSQGGREVTQNERERAVRTAGLAARAQLLQGNIETAQSLARDAVNFAFQDKTFKLNALSKQYNALSGQVSDQEQAILDERTRLLEEERAALKEVKTAVADAVSTGTASSEEITKLTSPDVPDSDKLVLAQTIQARVAREDRQLDQQERRAGIAQGWASIDLAERKFNYQKQQDDLNAEIERLKTGGEIDEQQEADIKKVEQALQLKELIGQIRGHAGFNLSVGSVGQKLFDPREGVGLGVVWNYLSGQGEGFDGLYDQLTNNMTLDNLNKMTGVLTDKDIEILTGAATRLRKSTSETEFLGVLTEMENVFDRTIAEKGVTPQQAQFYYGIDERILNEANSIWDNPNSTDFVLNEGIAF